MGATSSGATFDAGGIVYNVGVLDANGGTIKISGALVGGAATIEGSGQIEFAAASSANVTFATGAHGTLILDQPSLFTGTIAGLAPGDSIDLANISTNNWNWNWNRTSANGQMTVTVKDNVTGITDTLKIAGTGTLTFGSDSHGGILITDTLNGATVANTSKPAPTSLAAMAASGLSPNGELAYGSPGNVAGAVSVGEAPETATRGNWDHSKLSILSELQHVFDPATPSGDHLPVDPSVRGTGATGESQLVQAMASFGATASGAAPSSAAGMPSDHLGTQNFLATSAHHG